MDSVYIRAFELDDWRKLHSDKHWRENHSAMSIAKAWHKSDGFPPPVAAVFRLADEPFASFRPLLIIPEHKVKLPGGGRDSQNDVWVLAEHHNGLASITVEGKVAEPFGDTITNWKKDASQGKRERLDFLKHTLGLGKDVPETIRYQLLHRTASAVMEAKRFRATTALMLVHSFSRDDAGFQDFQAFVALFGVIAGIGEVVHLTTVEGVALHAAWVRDVGRPPVPA